MVLSKISKREYRTLVRKGAVTYLTTISEYFSNKYSYFGLMRVVYIYLTSTS